MNYKFIMLLYQFKQYAIHYNTVGFFQYAGPASNRATFIFLNCSSRLFIFRIHPEWIAQDSLLNNSYSIYLICTFFILLPGIARTIKTLVFRIDPFCFESSSYRLPMVAIDNQDDGLLTSHNYVNSLQIHLLTPLFQT